MIDDFSEERTISSIEKTSFKLVKALGLEDPRTDKSQSLSAALEYLRWTAKETINSIATNQTLVSIDTIRDTIIVTLLNYTKFTEGPGIFVN